MGKTHDLPLKAYVELEVRDRNGKLIRKYRQPARSWVKNFLSMIYYALMDKDVPLVKQSGESITKDISTATGYMFEVIAGSENSDYGIFIGSGSKEYDFNDYALAQKIEHGTNSGQMLYGKTIYEDPVDDGSKYYVRFTRTFTNNSGGDITVTEIGLVSYCYGDFVLIARDVLDNPVTVPDGSALTVRYIIQYQYA